MKKLNFFKKLSTLLSVVFIVSIISGTAYAQEETVYYEGNAYEKTDLSDKTIEWLEWYNSLSREDKESTSYVPFDLQPKSRAKVSVMDANSDLGMGARLFPLSGGGEAAYNPSYWNNSSIIKKANCYAYAMDVICNTDMKLQPGELAGSQFTSLTATNIIAAAKKDGPYLGSGRTLVNSTSSATSTNKSYKVALVVATNDYHWYVQNSDGYWSHKRGWDNAT